MNRTFGPTGALPQPPELRRHNGAPHSRFAVEEAPHPTATPPNTSPYAPARPFLIGLLFSVARFRMRAGRQCTAIVIGCQAFFR